MTLAPQLSSRGIWLRLRPARSHAPQPLLLRGELPFSRPGTQDELCLAAASTAAVAACAGAGGGSGVSGGDGDGCGDSDCGDKTGLCCDSGVLVAVVVAVGVWRYCCYCFPHHAQRKFLAAVALTLRATAVF